MNCFIVNFITKWQRKNSQRSNLRWRNVDGLLLEYTLEGKLSSQQFEMIASYPRQPTCTSHLNRLKKKKKWSSCKIFPDTAGTKRETKVKLVKSAAPAKWDSAVLSSQFSTETAARMFDRVLISLVAL